MNSIIEYYINVVFNDTIFILYLTSLIVDIITGNLLAIKQRHWNSKTGINGSLRHLSLLSVMGILLPIITYTLGVGYISNGVMFYVIAQYTISILENLNGMGVDIADGFSQYFEYLKPKNRTGKQEDKNGVGKNE